MTSTVSHPETSYTIGHRNESQPVVDHSDDVLVPAAGHGRARSDLGELLAQQKPTPRQMTVGFALFPVAMLATGIVEWLF